MHSQQRSVAALTMARITAFNPSALPPVMIPIRVAMRRYLEYEMGQVHVGLMVRTSFQGIGVDGK